MAEYEIVTRQGSNVQRHYCGDIPVECVLEHLEWSIKSMIEYGIACSATIEVKFDDEDPGQL